MNRVIAFSAFIALIIVSSCSNDLDLVADWKDIPIVYGLLSRADEDHYIRVEKAFLDPNTSALEIAANADSLYYTNAEVQLERIKTGELFNLERTDGNLDGLIREEGIFAKSPNILYKIASSKIDLIGGETYRLIINRGDQLPLVIAETTVVGDYEMVQASPPNPIDWQYDRNVTISWRSNEKEAVFYDLKLIIHYEESVAGNPDIFEDKQLEWIVAKNILRESTDNPRIVYQIPGIDFYQFLKNNLDESITGLRIFRRMDVVITAGGKELFDYINIGLANTGITSSQVIPSYTNLSEGFGVFSSQNILEKKNFTVSSITRDSIRNGIFTKELKFQ